MGDQFWRVKNYLYQVQDKKREVENLQRRLGLRDENDDDYAELKTELSKAEEERKEAEILITDFVSELPSGPQMVVIKRYVDGESWEQIAFDMGVSVRVVQKFHGKALPILQEKYYERFPEEVDE